MKKTLLFILLVFSIFIPLVYASEGDYTCEHWDTSAHGGNPIGITTDGINIWILDYGDDEVYKYTMVGIYVSSWSTVVGNLDGRGIVTDGINIWVTDYLTDEVYKYDMDGVYVSSWDTSIQTSNPFGIATDGINMWISDSNGDKVYKYTVDGVYITSWSMIVANNDSGDICTDGTNIWITDYGNDEIYKYDVDGVYVSSWDTSTQSNDPYSITADDENMWVLDLADKEVYKYEGEIHYLTPNIPTKLFGAGFNDSLPYVELYWSHDLLNMDFFEVQNSTDKLTWDILGYNTTTQYTDYQVVNGTDRYYRIRACKYQPDGWHNSTFINNFETVYFLKTISNDNGDTAYPIAIILIICGSLMVLTYMGIRKR